MSSNDVAGLEGSSGGPPADAEKVGPTGLGGWLLLPMFGLIRTAFTHIRAVAFPAWPYPSTSAWAPDEAGSPVERVVLGLFAAAALALLLMMFRRSRRFPLAFIGYSLASMISQFVFFGLDAGAGLIPLGLNGFTIRPLVGAIAPAAVWIPYMLKSRRVANTFTRVG